MTCLLCVCLRAVLLTGSLARNEASYLLKEGRPLLLSDAEALVVLHDGAPLPARQATQSLCGLAEKRLGARGVRIHVSLSVVHGICGVCRPTFTATNCAPAVGAVR